MDDLSNFVLMEPVEVCTAEATAPSLVTWCKTLGVQRVWVNDTATHFYNAILTRLREALRVDHQFAVAYSPWSNGTCEPMVKEVVRSVRSILLEQRRVVSEWVDVLPAVQWALTPRFVLVTAVSRTTWCLVALLGRLSRCWRIRLPGRGIAVSWVMTRSSVR